MADRLPFVGRAEEPPGPRRASPPDLRSTAEMSSMVLFRTAKVIATMTATPTRPRPVAGRASFCASVRRLEKGVRCFGRLGISMSTACGIRNWPRNASEHCRRRHVTEGLASTANAAPDTNGGKQAPSRFASYRGRTGRASPDRNREPPRARVGMRGVSFRPGARWRLAASVRAGQGGFRARRAGPGVDLPPLQPPSVLRQDTAI